MFVQLWILKLKNARTFCLMILQFSDYSGLRCHCIRRGTPRWWCHPKQCWWWFNRGVFWVSTYHQINCFHYMLLLFTEHAFLKEVKFPSLPPRTYIICWQYKLQNCQVTVLQLFYVKVSKIIKKNRFQLHYLPTIFSV